MRTFAIVVNWNGGDENLACLASLHAAGLAEERIVFVDNGSRDGSLERVREEHPKLVFVEHSENLGFGEGSNSGARAALERGAEALFFLNNDATIDADCLAQLEASLLAGADLTGPRIVFKSDPSRLWAAGGELTWRENISTLIGNGGPDSPGFATSREVDYIPGCALLITRRLFETLRGFDARYFAYMEDVDLGVRAHASGATVRLTGPARAEHASSAATGGGYSARRKYMNAVNSVHFLRAHGDCGKWMRFLWFDVASLPLLFLPALLSGKGRSVLAKASGLLHGLLGDRITADRLEPGASWLWD